MKWKIGTLLVVGVATVTVGLSLFVTGYWSTEISESSGAVAAVSESEGDGLHDGIKAHGEYEIEVRDPDGTLVAKQVVPNAVTSGGKRTIAEALNGNPPPTWSLQLYGAPSPCGSQNACLMRIGTSTYTDHLPVQSTLKKQLSGNNINFSGSYIAGDPPGPTTSGTITSVRLYDLSAPQSTAQFSVASLSGVPYSKGQTINVVYTITIN